MFQYVLYGYSVTVNRMTSRFTVPTSSPDLFRGVTRIVIAKGRKICACALLPRARELLAATFVIYLCDPSGVTHNSAYVRIGRDVDPDYLPGANALGNQL